MFGKVVNLLRTLSFIQHMVLVDLNSGEVIGKVCDLCISKEGNVTGLLCECNGFFKKRRFLPLESIHSIGKEGIMIDRDCLMTMEDDFFDYTLHHQESINGRMTYTKTGDRLGLLSDVYFQENLGTIVGVEISDGFFSDLMEGKLIVQTDKPPTIGKDAIIVETND